MIFARHARKEQSQLEHSRLRREVNEWLEKRKSRDSRYQYRAQLNTIATILIEALQQLETALAALDLKQPEETVYAECRLFDLRTVWLRRVWEFFKDKFDQRDDSEASLLLQAADEVVWSCYQHICLQLSDEIDGFKPRPAPLPFIEPYYAPEAFPSDLVPSSLKDTALGGSFLRDYLNTLPVAVVRLPPASINAPWWLVYLGHEIGHHIQSDLKLIEPFRKQIETIVEEQDGSESDIRCWGNWSKEIFADLISVHLMGPWAVRAMAELELNKPEVMRTRRDFYPAPVVRLKLLAESATQLGFDGYGMLQGLNLSTLAKDYAEATYDLNLVSSIVYIIACRLPDLNISWQDLTGFDREKFQQVDDWAEAFLDPDNLPPITHELDAARLMSSALLAAWTMTLDKPQEQRKELARNALRIIRESRDDTRRAQGAEVSVEESTKSGIKLADILLKVDPQKLQV
jgi:hypothetical protein